MRSRLELHKLLKTFADNVYFQPPASISMQYPAIRYSVDDVFTLYSDNHAFLEYRAYQIIVIDKDPDSKIYEKLLELPMCSFDRMYTADNLNHYVLTLYY